MRKPGIRTSRPTRPDNPPSGRGIRAKDLDASLPRHPLPSPARSTQTGAESLDRLERKPARGGKSAAPTPPPNALKRIKKTHFLEPYRLTEAVRTALLTCLTDQGIGDRESRDLFAAAVEYGIAGCRASSTKVPRGSVDQPAPVPAAAAMTASTEPVTKPSASIPPITEAARLFLKRLAELNPPARADLAAQLRASDPFDRVHESAYLDAVSREVERIAEAACARPDPASSPPFPNADATSPHAAEPVASDTLQEDPHEAQPSKSARRLVLSVAHAYETCLETQAEATPGSAFVEVLRLLAADAGIALPQQDAWIAELLI